MTMPVVEEPFELAYPQPNCYPKTPRRGRLIKEHECAVSYPDGFSGSCSYRRFGPAYHAFDYSYGIPPGKALSHFFHCQPVQNDLPSIEAKCRELAETAFWRAVEQERRDWFARAVLSESQWRTVDPSGFQMCLRRARALGGRYALCVKLGNRFVPATKAFDSLKDACQAWREGDRGLCVCCCSRIDRNWQLPRLNPLVLEGHPRRTEP